MDAVMCPPVAADVLGKNWLLSQDEIKSEVGIWLGTCFGGGHPEFSVRSREGVLWWHLVYCSHHNHSFCLPWLKIGKCLVSR